MNHIYIELECENVAVVTGNTGKKFLSLMVTDNQLSNLKTQGFNPIEFLEDAPAYMKDGTKFRHNFFGLPGLRRLRR